MSYNVAKFQQGGDRCYPVSSGSPLLAVCGRLEALFLAAMTVSIDERAHNYVQELLHSGRSLILRSAIAREVYSAVMLGQAISLRSFGSPRASLAPLMRAWRVSQKDWACGRHAIHWATALVRQSTREGDQLLPLKGNRILSDFVRSPSSVRLRREHGAYPLEDRIRLRLPRPSLDPERQGGLIMLKAPMPKSGEKGVLLVKYSEAIEAFPAVYTIEDMTAEFAFVLEPSWWGYPDPRFLYYIGSDARVIVQAPVPSDRRFLLDLCTNLVPVEIGAGDWVDPKAFEPPSGAEKLWDVAMVASWSRAKRHTVLFRALRDLQRDGINLSAVLVGYPLDLNLAEIKRMASKFHVLDQCTFFEAIPHKRVGEIVARSKVSVLLSRREGANKAIYESMFVDTPILVPAGHLGVNPDHVNQVGARFIDEELPDHLLRFAREPSRVSVRAWALGHTGAYRATETINDLLRQLALDNGEPWTLDIVPKKNAPNLRYLEAGRFRDFEDDYTRMAKYLR